jgi:hypothetical protein
VTTVVYIAGMARSGSTLLEAILGGMGDAEPIGESCFFWERAVLEETKCSCGRWARECPFWGSIIAEARSRTPVPPTEIHRLFRRYGAHAGMLRTPVWRSGPVDPGSELGRYLASLDVLYGLIRAKSGKKILIDSSKYPAYGALLSRLQGYDVRFVHLVRDSRDVANSVRKEMPYHGDGSGARRMKTHSVAGGGIRWLLSNAGAAVLPQAQGIPSIRIRYEDLVGDPEAALRPLADLIGVVPETIPVRGRVAELRERHQISGNPSRFEVGKVEIKRLGRGRELLTRGEEAVVTALTLPGLWRYGYLGRPGGRRP